MKKTLFSIIFALALSVMLFVTASAAETTKAEEWYNSSQASTGLVMDVIMETDAFDIKQTVYTKGEKAASEVVINDSLIRIIADEKDVIIFSPELPFIHIRYRGMIEDITSGLQLQLPETTEFSLTFVKSYEETEGETVYYVEEFINEEEETVSKYYFTDDELDKIKMSSPDAETVLNMIIDIKSYEVDDSIFEIPWYSINIAFLVRLFGWFIF